MSKPVTNNLNEDLIQNTESNDTNYLGKNETDSGT